MINSHSYIRRAINTLCFIASVCISATLHANNILGVVEGKLPSDLKGNFAYIDPALGKIIEVNGNGELVWSWSIPTKLLSGNSLFKGADIEWLPKSHSFLFVIPGKGVFEVSKKTDTLIWSCLNSQISHDADRLPNGNTIFVDGWDAGNTPIVTLVDPECKATREIYARDLGLDKANRNAPENESYSDTHINAVQVLPNGDWLLSLRNYGQMMRLSPDGKVLSRWRKSKKGHDPYMTKTGEIYFASHGGIGDLVRINNNRSRDIIFSAPDATWNPLRTVELVQEKYFLLTGSELMGLIDLNGNLLWSMRLNNFVPQRQSGGRPFLYKAVFVPEDSASSLK